MQCCEANLLSFIKELRIYGAQRAQYGPIKEYGFNHIRDPYLIQGTFLN